MFIHDGLTFQFKIVITATNGNEQIAFTNRMSTVREAAEIYPNVAIYEHTLATCRVHETEAPVMFYS